MSYWKRDRIPAIQEIVNGGVRRAYRSEVNPLRASMVSSPLGARKSTRENTPGIVHVELVTGDRINATVVAKGGDGDGKARFATLNPSEAAREYFEERARILHY